MRLRIVSFLLLTLAWGQAQAVVVLLDDHFDDGAIATNTLGVGNGFFTEVQGPDTAVSETGSALNLTNTGPGNNVLAAGSNDNNFDFFNATGLTFKFDIAGVTNTTGRRSYIGVGSATDNLSATFAHPAFTNNSYVWVQLTNDDGFLTGTTEGALIVDRADGSGPSTLATWTWAGWNQSSAIGISMDLDENGYNLSFDDGTADQTGSWGGFFNPADWATTARLVASHQGVGTTLGIDRVTVTEESVPAPFGTALLLTGLIALRARRA